MPACPSRSGAQARRRRGGLAAAGLAAYHAAVIIVPFLLVAVLAAPGKTPCDPAQYSREYEGTPMPGVPLVGGYVSGSLRERLGTRTWVLDKATVELFPGDPRPAKLLVNEEDGLVEIVFNGHLKNDPGEALTARFGRPIRLGEGVREMARLHNLQPYYPERTTRDKWCDGATVYILLRRPDAYELTVTPARLPPWRRPKRAKR